MSWTYNNEIIEIAPENAIGFVYLIVNKLNNRQYIGKKFFTFSKTKYKMITLKNGTKKKKKIKSQISSDWLTYWSSCEELKADIKNLGECNFTREILFICYSKAECTYIELREQIIRRVLESDDYYNGQISARCHKSHIRGKLQ